MDKLSNRSGATESEGINMCSQPESVISENPNETSSDARPAESPKATTCNKGNSLNDGGESTSHFTTVTEESNYDIVIHPIMIPGIHNAEVVIMPEVRKILRKIYQAMSQANYYLQKASVVAKRFLNNHLMRLKMLGLVKNDVKVCSYITLEEMEKLFKMLSSNPNFTKVGEYKLAQTIYLLCEMLKQDTITLEYNNSFSSLHKEDRIEYHSHYEEEEADDTVIHQSRSFQLIELDTTTSSQEELSSYVLKQSLIKCMGNTSQASLHEWMQESKIKTFVIKEPVSLKQFLTTGVFHWNGEVPKFVLKSDAIRCLHHHNPNNHMITNHLEDDLYPTYKLILPGLEMREALPEEVQQGTMESPVFANQFCLSSPGDVAESQYHSPPPEVQEGLGCLSCNHRSSSEGGCLGLARRRSLVSSSSDTTWIALQNHTVPNRTTHQLSHDRGERITVNIYTVDGSHVVAVPDLTSVIKSAQGYQNETVPGGHGALLRQVNYYLAKLKTQKQRFSFSQLKAVRRYGTAVGNATYCSYVKIAEAIELLEVFSTLQVKFPSFLKNVKWRGPISLDGNNNDTTLKHIVSRGESLSKPEENTRNTNENLFQPYTDDLVKLVEHDNLNKNPCCSLPFKPILLSQKQCNKDGEALDAGYPLEREISNDICGDTKQHFLSDYTIEHDPEMKKKDNSSSQGCCLLNDDDDVVVMGGHMYLTSSLITREGPNMPIPTHHHLLPSSVDNSNDKFENAGITKARISNNDGCCKEHNYQGHSNTKRTRPRDDAHTPSPDQHHKGEARRSRFKSPYIRSRTHCSPKELKSQSSNHNEKGTRSSNNKKVRDRIDSAEEDQSLLKVMMQRVEETAAKALKVKKALGKLKKRILLIERKIQLPQ